MTRQKRLVPELVQRGRRPDRGEAERTASAWDGLRAMGSQGWGPFGFILTTGSGLAPLRQRAGEPVFHPSRTAGPR